MKKLIIFCFILLTSILLAQEEKIDEMYETIRLSNSSYIDSVGSINYFKPIKILIENENKFKDLDTHIFDTYKQMMESAYSYVHYDNMTKKNYGSLVLNKKTKTYKANSYIKKNIKDYRIVMLNEAHHVPKNRLFAETLLKPLHEKGFKYLAIETLYWSDTLINKRKYPISTTGYYSREPYFANFIRSAINMGFTIIPYEQKENSREINKREENQANNLIDFVLNNPQEKIFVYAGYSHIKEQSDNEGIMWMAERFKDETKIDPLTISQTVFKEYSKFKKPVLIDLSTTKDTLLYKFKNMYDLLIVNPTENNYLHSVIGNKEYEIILPKKIINNKKSILLQAYLTNEYFESKNKAIPYNQKIIKNGENKLLLYLNSKKKYIFIIKDSNGNVLHKKESNISNKRVSL